MFLNRSDTPPPEPGGNNDDDYDDNGDDYKVCDDDFTFTILMIFQNRPLHPFLRERPLCLRTLVVHFEPYFDNEDNDNDHGSDGDNDENDDGDDSDCDNDENDDDRTANDNDDQ